MGDGTSVHSQAVGPGPRRAFDDRPPVLIVVSRRFPALYHRRRVAFADTARVEVFVDRRRGDRRQARLAVAVDRRRVERRTYRVAPELEGLGWAIVRRRAGAPTPAAVGVGGAQTAGVAGV